LKILKRSTPKARERFKREVEAQRALSPEVSVPLIDFSLPEDDKAPLYVVMELATHGSLWNQTEFLHGNLERCLGLFRKILVLVGRAHEKKIVHRDVKPGNILFLRSPNEPRLADFGLCCVSPEEERITSLDERVGPYAFIAPEQELGRHEDVDSRADLFSLGKLLHWMFTGKVVEGASLVPPSLIEKRTGDGRYSRLYGFLSSRLVVSDPQRRCRSVDDLLAEFDNGSVPEAVEIGAPL
jgi:serine/threonine protein kinase